MEEFLYKCNLPLLPKQAIYAGIDLYALSWGWALSLAPLRAGTLNISQGAAILQAFSGSLSLWQGPPGTGKTLTLAHYLDIARSMLPLGTILASAASNVAVDNLTAALMAIGVKPVRVGRLARVGTIRGVGTAFQAGRIAVDVFGGSTTGAAALLMSTWPRMLLDELAHKVKGQRLITGEPSVVNAAFMSISQSWPH